MEEAQKVLSDASKKNGMPVEPDQIVLTKPSTSSAKGSFLDIMKHPTLRIHLIIMYFNWFTTAFIMYGLALSWQNLTGGLFLNFIIGTILDFPAKTLAMFLAQNVGRKYPYAIGSTTTGIMFLITVFIPRDVYPSNWPIVVLALIGNFCTTMCFAILYMYTGQILLSHSALGSQTELYHSIRRADAHHSQGSWCRIFLSGLEGLLLTF